MAIIRLKSEWKSIINDPPPLCYAEPSDDDMFHWKAIIMGPPESPYKGTALFLKIEARKEHPFKPPIIRLIFPIYHPNINEHGSICVDHLRSQWSPATTIPKMLICISSIFSDPLFDEKPLNPEAAKMYEEDRENYNKLARDSCRNHFTNPEYQSLYFKFCFWQFGNFKKKLLNYNNEHKALMEDLCYPNNRLVQNFKGFEKKAFTFIPMNSYKMATKFYPMIEKWIKIMAETKDIQFVENNIEYRICKEINNKELWKFYFQFLNENDKKKLLQMYSLYCRFFPLDVEIFEEYKLAAEEIGPSLVPWKKQFKFEILDENVTFAIPKFKQSITCFFSPKNNLPQNFPFKSPLINYVLQNAPPAILQKLQMSCKYFFIRSPNPICYKLEIVNDPTKANAIEFNESSMKIINKIPENFNFENIYLAEILTVERNNDRKILSSILSKFHKFDAKYISIIRQNLAETEIKFLVCNKNVIELELCEVKIVDADGNESTGIMLEEILKLAPSIKQLRLDCVQCNDQTSQKILDLNFKNKVDSFRLEKLSNQSLEPHGFAEFVKKNAAGIGLISLQFLTNVDNDYKRNFQEILKNSVNENWISGTRPIISIL